MKSQPYTIVSTTSAEPTSKYHKVAALKMKTTTPLKTRKRPAPQKQQEQHTPLPPLPSISTLFESGSSSHSSSSNSSYGSYCQFSPEGSYTMYHWPMNYIPYVPASSTASTSTMTASCPSSTCTIELPSPPMSADEHKPVTQPLFIQTADYPYDYSNSASTSGGYPSSAIINANELLLRPVPNGGGHY